MKKILLVSLAIFLLYLVPGKAFAGTAGVGAMTNLTWWEPYYESAMREGSGEAVSSIFRNKPRFMYGPAASYSWDDWSVSLLFLTGHFFPQSEFRVEGSPITIPMNADIWRYDVDLAAGYQILPFLKIFAGFKYQAYIQDVNGDSGRLDIDARYNAPGMALGVSFTVPLADNLSMVCNLSGLYQAIFIKIEQDFNSVVTKGDDVINGIGGNVVLSLSYFIEPMNTQITLGGRYQFTHVTDSNSDLVDEITSKGFEHIYGVFLSAMYIFEI